ncbi:hypothetical protein [Marinoscillum sp.]|uniref:hypothetical protein n=1 Tax=Marinoscillum sp. TaxID=2024838 RepID=UPI003BAC79B9
MKRFVMLCWLVIGLSISGWTQQKLTAEDVIGRFLEATGGKERWLNLDSRVEKCLITKYETDGSFGVNQSIKAQTIYYQSPDQFLEHTFSTKNLYHSESILFKIRTCAWYYTSNTNSVVFFEPEPITFAKEFPRTYLMEALNLEPIKKVKEEDGMYRVDFKDDRQDGGVQSLFFDKETFLIKRRSYVTKSTMTPWTFTFEEYQSSGGFKEPRKVELKGGGEPFMTIAVSEISYDVILNPDLFKPPVPCDGGGKMVSLDAPYQLPQAVVD